jgi:uncharacterized protein (DUF1810 family)
MAPTDDPFNLQRFVNAQAPVYEQVRSELQAGRKRSHWIWYIFPQIAGLGSSQMATRFAISSLDEARAYMSHPVLRARLIACVALVNAVEGKSIEAILGYPDDLKFRSSLTLFRHVAPGEPAFQAALDRYFAGAADPLTDTWLAAQPHAQLDERPQPPSNAPRGGLGGLVSAARQGNAEPAQSELNAAKPETDMPDGRDEPPSGKANGSIETRHT